MNDYRSDVAKELCSIQGLGLEMAEAVVHAGPSEGYLEDCLARGLNARQAAHGFDKFQNQYMVDLLATARIETCDSANAEPDEIPF